MADGVRCSRQRSLLRRRVLKYLLSSTGDDCSTRRDMGRMQARENIKASHPLIPSGLGRLVRSGRCGFICARRRSVSFATLPGIDVFLDGQRPTVQHVFVEVLEQYPVRRGHR